MLASLDSRAKFIAAVAIIITVLLLPVGLFLWIATALIVAGIILSKSSLLRITGPILLLGWMFVLTILIHGFTTPGHIVWKVPFTGGGDSTGLILTREGLEKGGILSLRISLATITAGLVALTTPLSQVLRAFEYFGKPLSLVGIKIGSLVMMITLALRFIPTLYDESKMLKKSLMARGWFTGKGFTRRITYWIPLLVPLIANGMRRSDVLAETLVVRGYDPNVQRSSMYEYSFRTGDYIAVTVSIIPGMLWILFAIA